MPYALTKTLELIWRQYVVDGDAGSGNAPISKADMRLFGEEVETMIQELYGFTEDFSGDLSISSESSPAQITSNQNNYAPTNWATKAVWRINSDTARSITGLSALTAGTVRIFQNVGSFTITFLPENTSSTAANRLTFSKTIVLRPGQSATLRYDGTDSRWRPIFAPILSNKSMGYSKLSVIASSNTTVDITADSINLADVRGETIRLGAAVSVSAVISASGANGLDTGAEAANTWYSAWVIYNPNTDTTAALLSVSATAPTMPSGYTFKVRVGWVRNDGSSNLYRTIQKGERAWYVVGTNPTVTRQMATGTAGSITTPTWVAVAVSGFVPTTAEVIFGSLWFPSNASAQGILIAPNNSYGSHTSTTNGPPVAMSNTNAGVVTVSFGIPFEFALESTNIYWASTATNGAVSCLGWKDNL